MYLILRLTDELTILLKNLIFARLNWPCPWQKEAENFVELIEHPEPSVVPHSLETGFALFLENDFSKIQWDRLVQDSKDRGASMYPSFYKLAKVKQECRPSAFSVETEACVQVSFQVMLNKSAERLVNAVGIEWLQEDFNNLGVRV